MTADPVWTHIPIRRIEDLGDAVRGAGLQATQMSRRLGGGLTFADIDGVICTSGLIGGRVALNGPLSQDRITLGIGLDVTPGTTHWHNERQTGNIGVFLPCDEHASLYTEGSFYATLAVSGDRLEAAAAEEELVLDAKVLGGTGFHPRNMDPRIIAGLERRMRRIHEGRHAPDDARIGQDMLRAAIRHLARPPHVRKVGVDPGLHGRIVDRARCYIMEHLSEPMTIEDIAAAAHTSRRTLFRAFADLLDDTPRSYVRRLRLHRIRGRLASDAEVRCTIAIVANDWGISDLGRMAGWYRDLFGERPSETLARARNRR